MEGKIVTFNIDTLMALGVGGVTGSADLDTNI